MSGFQIFNKIRDRVAQVVPVHFLESVPQERIQGILESTFADNDIFCHRHESWVVVDAGTPAEAVLKEAVDDSPLHGVRLLSLPQNRGKTGAIREALNWALAESDAEYFITRDCDGDNRIEDLPRFCLLADAMRGAGLEGPLSVFGCRPSLSKPMNWNRLQWETITNQVVFDLVAYLLARQGRVLFKNFWNQPALDLQSGYRLYDRGGAAITVRALSDLPEDREIYLMACEISPLIEMSIQAGTIGQVYRSTQVEQPVSSYAQMDFARYYGKLLGYYADHYQLGRPLVRQFFDNALLESEAIQSQLRHEMELCREQIDSSVPTLPRPPLM